LGSTGSTNTLGSFDDHRGSLCLEQPTQHLRSGKIIPMHGLRARSLLTTKEPDLPQVESNLNKSPQEDLVVTIECIKV
jgi:hypothetical protein